MLFPYKYVPHTMDRMQRYIDFIFFKVWCKARKRGRFSLVLFNGHPTLKEVMTAFHYDDSKGADFFYSHVERIYGHFANLSRKEIKQFKRWYRGNNNLRKVCANDSTAYLARYEDILPNHVLLSAQLKTFFGGLYDKVNIAALKKKIGHIDDRYDRFMRVNKVGKCPFCGITDILTDSYSRRDAYDHYLPKKLYPFNSINFRNLVPACHHCNSSYKNSKDPAFTPKDPTRTSHRRKIFYPYSNANYRIDVTVNLKSTDLEHLKVEDLELQFGPPALNAEIGTWKDVYGIEDRYRAKICGENDGKYWLTQVLDEWRVNGRVPAVFMATLARNTNSHPYAECNFLKKPFLDACQRAGLFNAIAEGA